MKPGDIKPSQLIKQYAIDQGMDPTKALVVIQYILTHKMGFLLHKNKTALLLIRLEPHVYEVHIVTQDTPLSLASSMVAIFKDIKKLKIKKLYGKADNMQIVILMRRILKRESGKIDKSDRKDYNWMIEI
jgi:hypothetical protein